MLPLTLAEQGISTDDNDNDASSPTTASLTTNDEIKKETTATNAFPADSCRRLPSGSEMKEPKGMLLLDAEHGKVVDGSGTSGGNDKSPPSCTLPCHRHRRILASRARICGLLVERGARRAWRRAPSEQQVALHKKYAALLEDDDGRNLCTFSG